MAAPSTCCHACPTGFYDMVFCDTDVRDYPEYLTAALRLLRPGGVVAFNDVLTSQAEAARDIIDLLRDDERLVPMMAPLGEGLLAAVKRND